MGNKSVNNLYKPMLEHSNVEQKFHKAAKGKTERPDVAVILEPTNIQRHVKNVVEQLENTAPEGYDVPHPEKAWKPSRHGKVCINEGTSRKVRMIEKPRYNYEQVIHHIVVSACYDIFMKGMYEFSCGSVPNRGAHYGKVITFDMFSMMVDEALEQMRTMLDSNEAVQKLIANEAGEGSE